MFQCAVFFKFGNTDDHICRPCQSLLDCLIGPDLSLAGSFHIERPPVRIINRGIVQAIIGYSADRARLRTVAVHDIRLVLFDQFSDRADTGNVTSSRDLVLQGVHMFYTCRKSREFLRIIQIRADQYVFEFIIVFFHLGQQGDQISLHAARRFGNMQYSLLNHFFLRIRQLREN